MRKAKTATGKYKVILTIVTLAFVGLIWGNSLVPGKESGQLSGSLLNLVNTTFSTFGINYEMTQFVIRKIAHFTEYFILGILLRSTLNQYVVPPVNQNIFSILFIGLLVPVIDEFIQLFVDGRGGEIRDVIIDFAGVLIGMLICSLIINIKRNLRKGR